VSVPAFDLARAYRRFAPELASRWQGILDTTAFVLGPAVREFEAAFAAHLGAAGCVGAANGTDALVVALRALDLAPGDEVIVPAFTFFATAEAVLLAGGRPVFADVDPETLNLDPRDAEARVGPRTVGVIGVHLYGRPFDVDAVDAVCARHRLWLLEDAAQAQGASWRGRRVGTLGRLAAWSFYPSKNLGCFGDGGAITGPDAALLERVRRLANHGQTGRYRHADVGTNSRLDSLQAAVLLCRLPLLEADNARRRELACKYHGALAGVGDLRLLVDPPGALSVYHQLTVRTRRRSALQEHLAARGVGSSVHYPAPLHRLAPLAPYLDTIPSLPYAEAAAEEVLSLPMFPELTDSELDEVCAAVRCFFAESV
jgi:dTDP-4-amino-4,6-dideoxygalactose transaminase